MNLESILSNVEENSFSNNYELQNEIESSFNKLTAISVIDLKYKEEFINSLSLLSEFKCLEPIAWSTINTLLSFLYLSANDNNQKVVEIIEEFLSKSFSFRELNLLLLDSLKTFSGEEEVLINSFFIGTDLNWMESSFVMNREKVIKLILDWCKNHIISTINRLLLVLESDECDMSNIRRDIERLKVFIMDIFKIIIETIFKRQTEYIEYNFEFKDDDNNVLNISKINYLMEDSYFIEFEFIMDWIDSTLVPLKKLIPLELNDKFYSRILEKIYSVWGSNIDQFNNHSVLEFIDSSFKENNIIIENDSFENSAGKIFYIVNNEKFTNLKMEKVIAAGCNHPNEFIKLLTLEKFLSPFNTPLIISDDYNDILVQIYSLLISSQPEFRIFVLDVLKEYMKRFKEESRFVWLCYMLKESPFPKLNAVILHIIKDEVLNAIDKSIFLENSLFSTLLPLSISNVSFENIKKGEIDENSLDLLMSFVNMIKFLQIYEKTTKLTKKNDWIFKKLDLIESIIDPEKHFMLSYIIENCKNMNDNNK